MDIEPILALIPSVHIHVTYIHIHVTYIEFESYEPRKQRENEKR